MKRRWLVGFAAVASSSACNAILGLDPTRARDAGGDGALAGDANPGDRDGDGVANAIDDCPDAADADQADEDGDAVGDACDVCPEQADPQQADQDGDHIGDLCDPFPQLPGDVRLLFEPFNDPAHLDRFTSKNGEWAIDGGALHQRNPGFTDGLLLTVATFPAPTTVRTSAVVTADGTTSADSWNLGVWLATSPLVGDPADGTLPTGFLCEVVDPQLTAPPGSSAILAARYATGGVFTIGSPPVDTGGQLEAGTAADLRGAYVLDGAAGGRQIGCSVEFAAGGAAKTLAPAGQIAEVSTGVVGLRTHRLAADFKYVVVYGRQ